MSFLKFIFIGALVLISICSVISASDDLEIVWDRAIEDVDISRSVDYSDTLKKVVPSVVTIKTIKMSDEPPLVIEGEQENALRERFGLPPLAENDEGKKDSKENGEYEVPLGVGSGVVISANGYILTNSHVVASDDEKKADIVEVVFSDGRIFESIVVGIDFSTDLALLKIEVENLPVISWADSDLLNTGNVVFAIGSPLGVGLTVTSGIISATCRSDLNLLGVDSLENFIQTDAAINHGNSGGALIDRYGRLIGINTAIVSHSGGNVGLGFAIPVNLAGRIVEELHSKGEIKRAYLSIGMQNIDRANMQKLKLKSSHGVIVTKLDQKKHNALMENDVIISIAGKMIKSVSELRFRISLQKPREIVEIELIRNEELKMVKVPLEDRDEVLMRRGEGESSSILLTGVSCLVLNDSVRKDYKLPGKFKKGLMIHDVVASSKYKSLLNPGMLILEINKKEFDGIKDARVLLRDDAINLLWVWENGKYHFIPIK